MSEQFQYEIQPRQAGDSITIRQFIRNEKGHVKTVDRIIPRRAPVKPPLYQHKLYVSVPTWLPAAWRESFERNMWDIAKLHDNDRGERGVISKKEADQQFYVLMRFRGYNRLGSWLVYKYLRAWGM